MTKYCVSCKLAACSLDTTTVSGQEGRFNEAESPERGQGLYSATAFW